MRLGDLTAVFHCGALTYEADIDPGKWRYATAQIYESPDIFHSLGNVTAACRIAIENSKSGADQR